MARWLSAAARPIIKVFVTNSPGSKQFPRVNKLKNLIFALQVIFFSPGVWAIDNGQRIAPGQWTEVVGIETDAGLCSAVFIAPSVLLTAAHCVLNQDMRVARDFVDLSLQRREHSKTFKLKNKIVVQPDFRMSADHSFKLKMSGYDLAIIVLADADAASKVGASIARLNLSESISKRLVGHNVMVVAFGADKKDGKGVIKKSLVAGLQSFENNNIFMLALAGPTGTLCSGDSGGGVFYLDSARHPVLIGLSSAILNSCGKATQRATAVNLLSQLCWIQQRAGVNLGCN